MYVLSPSLRSLSAYTAYATFEVLICTFHAYLGVHCIVLHTTWLHCTKSGYQIRGSIYFIPTEDDKRHRSPKKIHPDLLRSFSFRCQWNMWTDFCLLSEFQFSPRLTWMEIFKKTQKTSKSKAAFIPQFFLAPNMDRMEQFGGAARRQHVPPCFTATFYDVRLGGGGGVLHGSLCITWRCKYLVWWFVLEAWPNSWITCSFIESERLLRKVPFVVFFSTRLLMFYLLVNLLYRRLAFDLRGFIKG